MPNRLESSPIARAGLSLKMQDARCEMQRSGNRRRSPWSQHEFLHFESSPIARAGLSLTMQDARCNVPEIDVFGKEAGHACDRRCSNRSADNATRCSIRRRSWPNSKGRAEDERRSARFRSRSAGYHTESSRTAFDRPKHSFRDNDAVMMRVQAPNRSPLPWRTATVALLFAGYAGYYLCRSNFSAAMPLLGDELAGRDGPRDAVRAAIGRCRGARDVRLCDRQVSRGRSRRSSRRPNQLSHRHDRRECLHSLVRHGEFGDDVRTRVGRQSFSPIVRLGRPGEDRLGWFPFERQGTVMAILSPASSGEIGRLAC